MRGRAPLWIGLGLVAAGLIVLAIGATAGVPGVAGPAADGLAGPGSLMGGMPVVSSQPGPVSPGSVVGTVAAPRVVAIVATAQLRFVPDTVPVRHGETITFEVTTMGPLVHEFMVGRAADVAADKPGTAEIADLGMMRSGSVTYTFDGPGPYAFACHAIGHFEAGMTGTITLVP